MLPHSFPLFLLVSLALLGAGATQMPVAAARPAPRQRAAPAAGSVARPAVPDLSTSAALRYYRLHHLDFADTWY